MRPDDKIKKDTVPKDQRIHPDTRGMVRTAFEGLTPTEITVAGQPFCGSCQAVIRSFGGVLVTPFRAMFGLTPD